MQITSIKDFVGTSYTVNLACEFCNHQSSIKYSIDDWTNVLSEVYSLKCSECHNSTHTGEQRTPSEKLIFKLFEEFTAHQEEICDWNPNDQEALDNEKCVFADTVIELLKGYKNEKDT
jgi:transcription elongation factor Elf1